MLVRPRGQQMPLLRQCGSAQSGPLGWIANGSVCKGERWGARGSLELQIREFPAFISVKVDHGQNMLGPLQGRS